MQAIFRNSNYRPLNPSVLRLINEFEKEFEPLFSRAKKDWNKTIREFLRDATGLKLTKAPWKRGVTSADVGVEIRFRPDQDDEFVRLIDQHYPDLDFDEYVRLRDLLSAANEASRFFTQEDHPERELRTVISYCEEYFKKYQLGEILEQLFKRMGRSRDIWGAYYYGDHHIELYYLPLIIFSRLTAIELESAIVKVLTHELGHAYHHHGKDLDNLEWPDMPDADSEIKEGLAQYYTQEFVEGHAEDFPELKAAYKKMVGCQSGPYVVHLEWKQFTQEHVRHALFVTRRNSIEKYVEFLEALDAAKSSLRGVPTSKK